jgi:hypothetical protein
MGLAEIGLSGLAARAHLALGVLLSAIMFAPPAPAQIATAPLVPIVTPLRGDDGVLAQPGALSPLAAFAPLRLSLTQGLFAQGNAVPGCASREDASGNSVNGFQVQRYSYLPLTPNLVLHGFSIGGCPLDAGLGGAFTFSIPLAKKTWLVSGVGVYALPGLGGARPAIVTTAAHVDVVRQVDWGGTLTFGLGVRGRAGAGLFNANFGGSF